MSKFSHIIASIIATMDVAPSPRSPTILPPPKFKMLGSLHYDQIIFYKLDLATDLVFKLFMFILSDLFTLPLAFR